MQRSELARRTRAGLDSKFRTGLVRDIAVRPRSGWIRAVRTALGMSQEALGKRLSINKSSVNKLEHNEAAGTISVAKLEEAAAALGCRLVYALVPVTSLDDVVRRRAIEVAAVQLGYVGTTSALEAQEVDSNTRAEQLADYAEGVIARNTLWRRE
jgi:predicted DNA-binding mobile mystery protein A